MTQITHALVTGANIGIGYETARQLALIPGVQTVILACRNPKKAEIAKTSLEASTGKNTFKISIMDVSNVQSVRKAVSAIDITIDALIMNAGGSGGADPASTSGADNGGVTSIAAVNVLGHAVLVDEMLSQNKLQGTVLLSGTEAARGIPNMGFPQPKVKSGTIKEFMSALDGSKFKGRKATFENMYGFTKLVGTLWISSMARKHPNIRFITMSPGATSGTAFADSMPKIKKLLMLKVMFPLLSFLNQVHTMEVGAKRYIDAVEDDETYASGVFYGSKKGTTGPTSDQSSFFGVLKNETFQDNAHEAVHAFIK